MYDVLTWQCTWSTCCNGPESGSRASVRCRLTMMEMLREIRGALTCRAIHANATVCERRGGANLPARRLNVGLEGNLAILIMVISLLCGPGLVASTLPMVCLQYLADRGAGGRMTARPVRLLSTEYPLGYHVSLSPYSQHHVLEFVRDAASEVLPTHVRCDWSW